MTDKLLKQIVEKLPKLKKIDKSRPTDEKRFPLGFNFCHYGHFIALKKLKLGLDIAELVKHISICKKCDGNGTTLASWSREGKQVRMVCGACDGNGTTLASWSREGKQVRMVCGACGGNRLDATALAANAESLIILEEK